MCKILFKNARKHGQKISSKNPQGIAPSLRGLTHGQKFVIWMIIPVKNNSNDEFLARVYAN